MRCRVRRSQIDESIRFCVGLNSLRVCSTSIFQKPFLNWTRKRWDGSLRVQGGQPFLKIRTTLDIFNISGKIPVSKERLKIFEIRIDIHD